MVSAAASLSMEKELQYNISMMKVKNVIGYKEVGLNYKICEEIYEGGCGKDIEGRFLDVEFLKITFESTLELVEDSSEFSWLENEIVSMLDKLKEYDDAVLIEF